MLNSSGHAAVDEHRGPASRSFLTAGQAARLLGISPRTLNRWADSQRVPCMVTLGGHRRFEMGAIEALGVSMGLEIGDQHE